MRTSWIACAAFVFTAVSAGAAVRTEFRGFWVDTFNTNLNQHADVVAVISGAKAARANVIFAQVRRRGDSWYLNSLEPPPDFIAFDPGFDPLQDLITEAHANGMELHAFVIMGAIWNKNPTFEPTATLGPPTHANHVFNRHGGYDPATRQIVPGGENWLTRSLLPDGTAGISFQGHRFGSDFWLDFGHPDAAAYSVDVVTHLIRNYDVDGVHLDRIRYPEFSATGQTPTTGANIGYNARSIERFQRRYGIAAGSPPPSPGDPLWAQWRRDQVTNVVRRIYLNAITLRPKIKISAALIAFGGGPTVEDSWFSAEAYWRVYQDWKWWTEEGILDIAIPMNYKRDNVAAQLTWYNQWDEWTKNHQYWRATMMGLGVYLNTVEDSLAQVRRSLQPSSLGNNLVGVNFYSFANPDAAPNTTTAARGIREFASALTTGKSVDGAAAYEDSAVNPVPVFGETAFVPALIWKVAPTLGHLMGFARRADGTPLDSATVNIEDLSGGIVWSVPTDGGGFFGAIDLPPGKYVVSVELGEERLRAGPVQVNAGTVAPVEFR